MSIHHHEPGSLDAGGRSVELRNLSSLWREAAREHYSFLDPTDIAATAEHLREVYLPNAEVRVASIDGAPVGFVASVGRSLDFLLVDPDHEGQGIGTALLDEVTRHHHDLLVSVHEANRAGTEFYQKRRFQIYGRTTTDLEGRALPLVQLRRR